MAQPSSASLGVEDVYRSVISDVISNLRETFLDENVDVDILQQLKKEWEDKVNKSGAVNFDNNKNIPPPAIRHPQSKPPTAASTTATAFTSASTSHLTHQLPQSIHTTAHLPSSSSAFVVQPQQSSSMGLIQQTQQQPHPMLIQAPQQLIRQSQGAYYLPQQHQFLPQQTILLNSQTGGLSQHLAHQPQFLFAAAGQPQQLLQQLDPKAKKEVTQLDGGPGMTDSSSEEEEEEEDDSIKQYIGLQDERAEDGEGGEEDPLNSDDDQSDEEDLETLFDSENVVVCQFEKVNRARSKWKFILKDGIMHLNGADYCFQKCTGEAEW